jgi:hypothetical protein
MLERDARAADQEARERGENPAQAGWVDAGGEDEITGSEVPDVAGTQGGNGISSRYGE